LRRPDGGLRAGSGLPEQVPYTLLDSGFARLASAPE